jgi:peptidoglycan hydrolase-like protein with peptidoglycan-binding domain
MQKFSKKIAGVMIAAAFAVPMIASAESASTTGNTTMQAQIQMLLSQIKMLQEQIKTIIASSSNGGFGFGQGWSNSSTTGQWTPPGQMGKQMCITLNRSLHQGDSGDDVISLQQMLQQDPNSDFTGSATGFFGPLTAQAMKRFQMKNGIATSSDGTLGPMTRGFLERRCGNGLDGMTGKPMNPGMGNGQGGPNGKDGMPGMMAAAIRGTITANNGSSITVQTDGGTVTVNITSSTTIKVLPTVTSGTPPSTVGATTGTIADLVVGKKVIAMGPKNSDGSIQAMGIAVGDNLPPLPPMNIQGGTGGNMMYGNGKPPMGMMPTLNGPQQGPGTNGGPQNW